MKVADPIVAPPPRVHAARVWDALAAGHIADPATRPLENLQQLDFKDQHFVGSDRGRASTLAVG